MVSTNALAKIAMIMRPGLLRHGARALLAILAALPGPVLAQEHDQQLWFQANTNVPIAQDLRVTLEQIARFSDRQDGLYQTEFGALLSYKIARNVELGFGYRKVGAHNGNTGADEDRIRQQLVATFNRISTRFRVDERFNPRGDEVGFRIRPLIRYNHPIGRGRTVLFVSHESFFLPNSTAWGQNSGYERMRNIVGIAVPFGSAVAADIGYLNQFRPGRSGSAAQMDHALTIQLTINVHDLSFASAHD